MEGKPAPDALSTPPDGALMTLGLFLFGSSEAIRRLAATPRLWLVGLLFTLSAGLAREYDAEDLLNEPWHLLIAPGASLIAGTALWLFVHLSGLGHWAWSRKSTGGVQEEGVRAPRVRDNYLGFLALFWLTAPLAWLYGIPYERFQGAGDAASWNLWTLLLVAVWRVALMVRVLRVLYGVGPFVATAIVLFFGDVVMLSALSFIPTPIIALMGGVRLGEAEQVLASAALGAQLLGWLGGFFLFAIWLGALSSRGRPWRWNAARDPVALRPLVVLALIVCAWWCAWLPVTWPEQRLRRQIERAMVAGDLITGIDLLERHYPADLPPHWDPPPRRDGRRSPPDPLAVLLYLTDRPEAESIRRLYEDKLLDSSYSFEWDRNRVVALLPVLERQADAAYLLHGTARRRGVIALLEKHVAEETDNDIRERMLRVLQRYRK